MKKNYKKIYKRLIKEIKKLIDEEIEYREPDASCREKLIREIESSYAITTIEVILQIAEEVEGNRCCMQIMNQDEFKKWKEKIDESKTKKKLAKRL